MIFRMFLNNVFGETLPQCFSDPALLFLREESWLVRERETHVAVPEQPSAAPRQHPSAFRVRPSNLLSHSLCNHNTLTPWNHLYRVPKKNLKVDVFSLQ